MERGIDPFAELKQAREEYTVYDSHYEKIGKVDDVFVDEGDRALYVGVKMGFLGTNSTLIPTEIIRVNDRRRLIEVAEPAETIKHAPHFGSNEDLSPELENHVRTYFGLEPLRASPEHGSQDPYASDIAAERLGPDVRVDTEPGERAEAQEVYLPPLKEETPAREPDAAGRLGPDVRVDTEPGERAEEQERHLPGPGGIPPAEPVPEFVPESTGTQEPPIQPSEGPGDRWEKAGTISGTTVHRRRR